MSERPPREPSLGATILPGAVDHHVHLGLVDRELLAGGPLVEVVDCGWDPDEVLRWRREPPAGVTVRVAGPFHTAVGGYPAGREWAPATAIREIGCEEDARRAAALAAASGYDAFKIALNDAMPLLGDELLSALVHGAHLQELPVYVHAEGAGQALRAVRAGADVLVHAPWTEALNDSELHECVSAGVVWVSTLAIHSGNDRDRAIGNVRRFRELGGTVLYGTDMGNGDAAATVSGAELRALEQAGFVGPALLGTILRGDRPLRSSLPVPQTARDLITWLEECERA